MKAAVLAALALAACTDTRAPIKGTQSLKVELVAPADPGTFANRLPDTARSVTLKITAIGPDDQPDTSFNHPLQVYVQYLGTVSPYITDTPSTTVQMNNGSGMLSNFMLPAAFGPTVVWLEDACYLTGTGSGSASAGCTTGNNTYATGVSPTLWYRDPFIVDIRTPANESAPDAYEVGPVDGKNVAVFTSRYGAQGRLVITSKYSQGYTLADVKCADAAGTPPCTSQDYDYIDVFSYSAPLDQQKRFLNEGQTIDGFAGGVSEFDGLLEIGFPQTFVNCNTGDPGCPDINKAREPKPVVMDSTWFTNTILFKRNESNNLQINGAAICNLDADYDQYKQWKLDLSGTGGNCTGNLMNVVSSGIFDPTTYVGRKVNIIGNERSINIGSFHVFIMYPRSMSDITLL